MAFVKIVNAEDGSDARYDVNAATPEERRQLDSEGRPLSNNLPDQWTWTPGLPGARGGNGPGGGGGAATGGDSSIFGNPYFQQYEAANTAQQAADQADTKAQIQQILIQFGLIPGNFQDKQGALDDTIRQLIQQNTESGISQYARLLEGKQDTLRNTVSRLGAKGLLRSGAKGFRTRRNTLDFDRTLSDAIQAVLGNVSSLQSGYAGRESGRQMNLAQFLASLFQNYQGRGSFSNPTRTPSYSTPQAIAQGLNNEYAHQGGQMASVLPSGSIFEGGLPTWKPAGGGSIQLGGARGLGWNEVW